MKRKLKEFREIFDRRSNEHANDDANDTNHNAVPNVYSGDLRRLFHCSKQLKNVCKIRNKKDFCCVPCGHRYSVQVKHHECDS